MKAQTFARMRFHRIKRKLFSRVCYRLSLYIISAPACFRKWFSLTLSLLLSQGLQPFWLSFRLGVRAFSEIPCGLFTLQISFCRASGVVCPRVVSRCWLFIGFCLAFPGFLFDAPALFYLYNSVFLSVSVIGCSGFALPRDLSASIGCARLSSSFFRKPLQRYC